MNLDFGSAMRRAWQITWNHKILWIFGILSALFAGRASFNFNSGPRFPNTFNPTNPDVFPRLQGLFPNLDPNVIIAIGLGLACVFVIIAIVLYVLHVIGRGGLIAGIQLAEAESPVTFGQAWGAGIQHFWTVLLIGLVVAVVAVVIGVASVFAAATICLIPLACVGGIIVAALGIFTYLAQIAAVTENLSVTEAIGRAWQVVQPNLGGLVVMAIILVIIEGVVAFVIALPFLLALAPLFVALAAYFATAQTAGQNAGVGVFTGGAIIAGLCFVVWIPFAIVLGGILQTWVISAWTLAYKQLSTQPGSAMAPASPAPAVG